MLAQCSCPGRPQSSTLFLASAMFVHFRGRVRIKFYRQVTDHSTFMAPYNALMYLFSAVPNRPFIDVDALSRVEAADRQLADAPRRGAAALRRGPHPRARRGYNDLGFNSFFRRGWKRFYVKWYDTAAAVGAGAVPEDRRAGPVHSRRSTARCSRCCRPAASWASTAIPSPGRCATTSDSSTPNSEDCHIFVDGQPYSLARRRSRDVRRDVHPLGREQDRPAARDPVLRRRAAADQPRDDRVNKWYKNTFIRASQTENIAGDHVGWLNRIFSLVYYLRVPGKALKQRYRALYYVVKWLLLIGLVYWIFFSDGRCRRSRRKGSAWASGSI